MMRRQEERLLVESQRSYALSQLSPSINRVSPNDFESMLEVGGVQPIEKQGKQKTRGKRSAISVQKVEAAFRSEHQRGKKRTNLTDEERNELTRTRNRNHARNSRQAIHSISIRAACSTFVISFTQSRSNTLVLLVECERKPVKCKWNKTKKHSSHFSHPRKSIPSA